MKPSLISLTITNNTPVAQPVSIMNPNPANQGIVGNTPQSSYSYDVTNELLNAISNSFTYVSVVYSINNGPCQMLTVNYGSVINSVIKMVAALNSLGIGVFYATNSFNQISAYSIAPNGDVYSYSVISTNSNYTTSRILGANQFNNSGTIIYNTGYNINGSGILNRIVTSNPFWINSVPNSTSGAFNRSGIFTTALQYATISSGISMFTNVNCLFAGTYYIGFSAFNSTKPTVAIYVNNALVINANPNVCAANINTQLGTTTGIQVVFYDFWSIYPIQLLKGSNYISMLFSSGTAMGNPPSMAFEIYNNTPAEIAAATSYGGLNTLFSSSNYTDNLV